MLVLYRLVEKLKEYIYDAAITVPPLLLSLLLWLFDFWIPPSLLNRVVFATPEKLLKQLLILYILVAMEGAYIIYLFVIIKRKPNPKDFIFHVDPGCYEHKKDHYLCCQPCLDKNGVVSKLTDKSPREYYCRNCDQTYRRI